MSAFLITPEHSSARSPNQLLIAGQVFLRTSTIPSPGLKILVSAVQSRPCPPAFSSSWATPLLLFPLDRECAPNVPFSGAPPRTLAHSGEGPSMISCVTRRGAGTRAEHRSKTPDLVDQRRLTYGCRVFVSASSMCCADCPPVEIPSRLMARRGQARAGYWR